MLKTNGSFLLMYASFFVYSLSSIFSKLASRENFLSLPYILCFGGVIFVLGLYAVLWQQVLKKMPLSVAMANKPVALALNLLWAFLLFKEQLSLKVIVGVVLMLCGIIVIGGDDGGK